MNEKALTEWQAEKLREYPSEFIIRKQRGGEIGTVNLLWEKSTGRFREPTGGNGGNE